MYVYIYMYIYIYTHSVHLQTNKSSYTHAPIGPTTLFGSEVTPYSLAPGPNILRVGHSNLEKTLSKYINHKPTILSGNQTRVGNPLYLQSSNKIDGFPASHVWLSEGKPFFRMILHIWPLSWEDWPSGVLLSRITHQGAESRTMDGPAVPKLFMAPKTGPCSALRSVQGVQTGWSAYKVETPTG